MSFSIGLSGLRAVTEELDVISQNIANVNTAGYKSSRAEFAALYGGDKPSGVEVNNVSQNFERDGNVVSSGRTLDLAISGSGFFQLKDNGQNVYTRAGLFQKNSDNYIVNAAGLKLQGYAVDNQNKLLPGAVTDLQVSSASIPAKASTKVDYVGNLKADASIIAVAFNPADATTYNYSQSGSIYDSLGVEHTLTQYFTKTGTNAWTANYYVDGAAVQTQALTFNTDGTLATPATAVSLSLTPAGANAMTVALNISDMSQYASDFSVTRNQSDGYTAGDMTGVQIESDGSLMAVYSNGQTLLQGQVVMANFANPTGLRQGDNTTWYQTFSSGQATIGAPGSGNLGTLSSGSYEGSNVDLSTELVNLMTSQRNYQANAKTISTTDKMTQVLFNSF